MKFFSLAVLALVGSLSIEEVTAIDVRKNTAAKQEAREESSDSDSSDSDDDTFVQVRDPVTGFYTPQ